MSRGRVLALAAGAAILILPMAGWAARSGTPPEINLEAMRARLPDPLAAADGTRITTAAQWTQQRKTLLTVFRRQMYGVSPAAPPLRACVFDRDSAALGGLAVRRQITLYLQGARNGPTMDLLIYTPRAAKGPVPAILGLNFWGNETIHRDPGIRISRRWVESGKNPFVDLSCVKNHRATAACRGIDARRWPVEQILRRGYALATVYRGDIDPDRRGGFAESLRADFPKLEAGGDNFSTIGAWAWALSRAMDYLETDRRIDGNRVAVFGWSRLGKATLWAAAQDPRFAMAISDESGAGGAKLFHFREGQTIAGVNRDFPYWFCRNFRRYNGRDAELPFDQHMLLALIAPRPLYISSAAEDLQSGPKGEFLSAYFATPVYRLLGGEGLPADRMPAVNEPVFGQISYHIRSGKHDVTAFDWDQYLKAMDLYLRPVRSRMGLRVTPRQARVK